MKRIIAFVTLLTCFFLSVHAADEVPDTVRTGIYVTSIHDINFKDQEFTISFWLWLKYTNKDFDFLQNLEIPQAKTFSRSFATVDTSDGKVYILMKLQCVMKDSWRINNFPFDHQRLRLSIENSQFDSKSLVFVPDTQGQHFDPRFALRGWSIDSFVISSGVKEYETAFGDETVATPHTEYSAFRVKIKIQREAGGLFWKMFIGMYLAFLIGYACFFIHVDSIDSRFGLSVGALFAVIGNKYIIDSALPESSSFTLVDWLHGLTLFCILLVIAATAFSLKRIKQHRIHEAMNFDRLAAKLLLPLYIIGNLLIILL